MAARATTNNSQCRTRPTHPTNTNRNNRNNNNNSKA